MATLTLAPPQHSAQTQLAHPKPESELREFIHAARGLAFLQVKQDSGLWRCASCGSTGADRSEVVHFPGCAAWRVLKAFDALRKKVASHV